MFSSGGPSVRFLTRYDGEVSEPLVGRQGSRVSMRVARGSEAILAANIGVTPQTDGKVLRINVPELNEERRKEIVKVAKTQAEAQKVAMRNVRRDANDAVKKLEKDKKISEDEMKQGLDRIQKATDDGIAKIDAELKAKEAEVMAV